MADKLQKWAQISYFVTVIKWRDYSKSTIFEQKFYFIPFLDNKVLFL